MESQVKLYCGFKLDEVSEKLVLRAQGMAQVEKPLEVTPADRFHVTTAFLGEMSLAKASSILRAAAQEREFLCRIGAPAGFPAVLYLSVQCEAAHRVRDLQAARLKELTGKDLWPKVYIPHVTLAKVNLQHGQAGEAIGRAMERIKDFTTGAFTVHSLCLFNKSEVLDEVQLPPVGP